MKSKYRWTLRHDVFPWAIVQERKRFLWWRYWKTIGKFSCYYDGVNEAKALVKELNELEVQDEE